jgi:CRP-like cAMP-binding protein
MTYKLEQPAPRRLTSQMQPEDVQSLPLFDGVEAAIVDNLAAEFSSQHYPAGAVLLNPGDDLLKVQIIHRGLIDLTRANGEQECGVLLLSAKDLVTPAAAIFAEPSLVTVRALTPAKVFEIDVALIRSALARSPKLSNNMMKAMSGQWRMAVRNILDLTCRSAPQRLGAFLLRLADLQNSSGSPVLPISKGSLATRLGIRPETLSRTLQIVADHGLHLRGREIMVRDRRSIEEFCGPDPYPEKDERRLNVFVL